MSGLTAERIGTLIRLLDDIRAAHAPAARP